MRFLLPILLTLLASATANAQGLTINAQIHNAPGWEPNTTYTYTAGPPTAPFTRVVNGSGWTPSGGKSGTWHSGSALAAYQLISPTTGTCTSASSGGPTGTALSIPDNTCTWKYLSGVDYISLSGSALDNGIVWTSGTDYGFREVVNTGANSDVYQQQAAGCHSTVQPTGTSQYLSTSDGCIWTYRGTIYYTSRPSHPHLMESFWHDTFQGYIVPGTTTFHGSVSQVNGYSILAVDQIDSGTIHPRMFIIGTGIAAGQFIVNQRSGRPGGIGTYLINGQGDAAETTITGSYGILTVTTPPATHALDASTTGDMVSNAAMGGNTGAAPNGQLDSYGGTYVIGGSGRTFIVNISQTVGGSPGSPTPVTLYHGSASDVDYLNNDFYHAQLWNDREYVSGQLGELSPILIWNHNYAYNDSVQWGHTHVPSPASSFHGGEGFPYFIEAAPGESFADTFLANPSLPLTGYNVNNGVAIRGIGVSGLAAQDNIVVFRRLQVSSNMSNAMFMPSRACNTCWFDNNILQGGPGGQIQYSQADAVVTCGAACFWQNNLIIARGLLGIWADYGGDFYNNTFVCPSGTCGSAMSNTRNWANHDGMVISGNAVFGFHYFTSANYYGQGWQGTCSWDCSTVQGTNNVTDGIIRANFPNSLLTGSTIDYGLPFHTGSAVTPTGGGALIPICGNTVGNAASASGLTCRATVATASAAFVAWPTNFRTSPSGPLVGAGASFNRCTLIGWGAGFCSTPYSTRFTEDNPNTPDLFGSTRPQGTRYDAGAIELLGGAGGSSGSTSGGAGRLIR